MKNLNQKKGNIVLYVILLTIVIGLMFFIKQCSHPTSAHADRRAGGDTINVAIELSPTAIKTEGDTLSGFHYELLQDYARQKNVNIKFYGFANLQTAIDGLNSGRYDLVVSDIPTTVKLKNDYIFTDPIYVDRRVLVKQKSNDTIPFSLIDLAHDTVHVAAGAPASDRLSSLSREIGDTIYIVEDPDYGPEQLAILVALGEIKQAVIGEEIAKHMVTDYPNLDISNAVSFNQFQSWMTTPYNQELCDSINSWFAQYSQSDRFNELKTKYLHTQN